MEPLVYAGKEVKFSSVTGKIAGSSKRSETDVIGSGGGWQIQTTVTVKQEFFIRCDDGREVLY